MAYSKLTKYTANIRTVLKILKKLKKLGTLGEIGKRGLFTKTEDTLSTTEKWYAEEVKKSYLELRRWGFERNYL